MVSGTGWQKKESLLSPLSWWSAPGPSQPAIWRTLVIKRQEGNAYITRSGGDIQNAFTFTSTSPLRPHGMAHRPVSKFTFKQGLFCLVCCVTEVKLFLWVIKCRTLNIHIWRSKGSLNLGTGLVAVNVLSLCPCRKWNPVTRWVGLRADLDSIYSRWQNRLICSSGWFVLERDVGYSDSFHARQCSICRLVCKCNFQFSLSYLLLAGRVRIGSHVTMTHRIGKICKFLFLDNSLHFFVPLVPKSQNITATLWVVTP